MNTETAEVVKSDEFERIERSLFEAVVERDTLSIQEIELFKAMNLWAKKKCEEQGLSTDGSEKRRVLGERIVKGIRFPVMTQHEFTAFVLDCKILTPDEAFRVVKYFNSVPDTPVEFSKKKRISSKECRCRRFRSVVHTGSGYPYRTDKSDCLLFKVNKDISLLGVTLCGDRNCDYSVGISIKNLSDCFSFSELGKFSSVCIQAPERVPYYGFNIFFDRPVVIKKGGFYRIEAYIRGANSCFGVGGGSTVLCSGVKFSFDNCPVSSNGTRVGLGQFPEFLFTVI